MNNKIVSTKTTSAIFLAIVLVTGTIAAISPFIIKGVNAQGEPYYGGMDNSYDDRKSYGMDDSYGYSDYRDDKDKKYDSYGPPVYGMDDSYDKKPVYGMDNSYDDRQSYDKKSNGNDNSYKPQYTSYDKKDDRDKSKDSKVDIKKIKCNNINLNANGGELNETSSFPFLSDIIGEKESDADERGVSSYGSYDGDRSYGSGHSGSDSDFKFVCINNNNNTVIEAEEPTPPTPPTANLNVTKTVSCEAEGGFLFEQLCNTIETGAGDGVFQITPDEFTIQVTGNNPNPSSFDGSTTPVVVTLGAGDYEVTETEKATVQATILAIETANPTADVSGPFPTFTGDCDQVGVTDTATGTIAAGESQTCNKNNEFRVAPDVNG